MADCIMLNFQKRVSQPVSWDLRWRLGRE